MGERSCPRWVPAAGSPLGACIPYPGWTNVGEGRGHPRACASGRYLRRERLRLQPCLHLCQGLSLIPSKIPAPRCPPRPTRGQSEPCLALELDKGAQFLEMIPLLNNRTAGQLGPRNFSGSGCPK